MKLNSKSGATLAAAAATLFLAGVAVSTIDARRRRSGQVHGRQRLQGPERLQERRNACKGLNACKGKGFSMIRKPLQGQGRRVRQGLIVVIDTTGPARAPGLFASKRFVQGAP